jgi:hypothetical protein
MSQNPTNKMTLIIFGAITLIGFFIGILSMGLLWFILQFLNFPSDIWALIEAISTAFATAALLGGGFVAYQELSEVSQSRHMEVANRLFDELNSQENIEARRWIFQNLKEDPEEGIRTMSDDGQAAIKQVLNSLDHVAFLTQPGWIPDEVIMPWMHPMIAKSWEKLEPYVLYERKRRNEPYYYQHAGELARRCYHWRDKNIPDIDIKWVDDAL